MGVLLSQTDAARIAKAVKRVEAMKDNALQPHIKYIPNGGEGGKAQWAKIDSCNGATAVCKLCTGDYPSLTVTDTEITAAIGERLYGTDAYVIVAKVTGSADVEYAIVGGAARWQFYEAPGDGELSLVQDDPPIQDLCTP